MKRTPLRRRPREKPGRRPLRPGHLPPLPKDWVERCRLVKGRDMRCRFGGCSMGGDLVAVDHIIPRRAIPMMSWKDDATNLSLLCAGHHAGVKASVERLLFQGRTDPLDLYLSVLRRTGPVPTQDQLAAVYAEIRRLVFPMAGRGKGK